MCINDLQIIIPGCKVEVFSTDIWCVGDRVIEFFNMNKVINCGSWKGVMAGILLGHENKR